MLQNVPCSKRGSKSAASAALDAFSRRRKRKQRPSLKLAAVKTRELSYPPTFLDDFDFFAFKKSNSASCRMAADFWPFFF
jgi:hypothetical protein